MLTEPCGQLTNAESPRILTPIQAYELALNTIKTFENKWEAYVKEEARLLSVFDGRECSYGTMSRSLLNSALRVTEIERLMGTSRPSEPDRSTNKYMDLKAYILCLLRKGRSTLFFRSKHYARARGYDSSQP